MIQIFTGHGCFGEYLGRIGKEQTGVCVHCGYICDSAQHTLAECPSWTNEREEMAAVMGTGNCPCPL